MWKSVVVLALAIAGFTLAGCKASADIDPHGSSSIVAPQ
jgi:hypothetical protein